MKKIRNEKETETQIEAVKETEENKIEENKIEENKTGKNKSEKNKRKKEVHYEKEQEEQIKPPKDAKFSEKIRFAMKYSIQTWIFKCFAVSFCLEILLEILGRRSIIGGIGFMLGSPIVFIYNVSIIFFTMLFALFLKKRLFGMIVISAVWLGCGIVNFIVLGFRVTPFAAIDFLMLKDTFSMIDVYYTKFQQVLILIAIIAVVAGLVILFIKTPKIRGQRNIKRTMLVCVLAWVVVWSFTNIGVNHNMISDDFANLGSAYKDYGFAYCFTNSIIDNGISKPDNYSAETMNQIKEELADVSVVGEKKTPNVIIIQLESFFDPNNVQGLTLSQNPIPNFTKYLAEYPSGYLTVPAVGAGTANTEFEVLTGIKTKYFGAGEYPYKTTVNTVPVEGLCSVFMNEGYGTHAIHNNKSSFYDRKNVFEKMGFDSFTSLEYMYDIETTATGWAKDATLVDDIMKSINSTDQQDFVFAVSVQGHGKYPSEEGMCEDDIQVTYDDAEMQEPFHYYINQIYEMDQMIADLKEQLDNSGEEYVLILYGDHLPSLELTEEQLQGTMYQTEYVMVNNIGIKLADKDLLASEVGTRLLQALSIEPDYAERAHMVYKNEEELDEKLALIAYDMLFGDKYLFDGNDAVPEHTMTMGVDIISLTSAVNEGENIVVSGENFNEYSTVIIDGDRVDTVYVDRNTLLVEETNLEAGQTVAVSQIDKSHHELSTTNEIVAN